MKKRIFALCAAACLAFSITACGGGSDTQDAATDSTEQTAETEESADSGLPSLEEYFNSDAMQSMVDAAKEQYEEEGISAELYAEGDELRYDFTMTDIVTTEEERPALAEALQTSTEANADSYINTATEAKAAVSNDTVTVVLTFMDGEGNVLYTQSFSSEDAE